jgi:hypothetical protein
MNHIKSRPKQSFGKTVLDILHKRGATEIRFLVRTALKSTPVRKAEEALMEEVLVTALNGETGTTVAGYPTYCLKMSRESQRLPTGKYARTALLALKEAKGKMALPALVSHYNAKYRHSAICPEFWMWRALGEADLAGVVARTGALCIGLTDATRKELDEMANSREKVSPPQTPGSIAERMGEKSLETMLASRPDLLESGLTVFQRQSRIPVGIIDLLCIDRKRNYVVVEIKRPAADYREVVGQITTYMGWVRKNIATKGQSVRGIIVVGRKNDRLDYSLDLIPDISVRTFF